MLRVVAILAGIFLAAYLTVHLGYARLEKELLGKSCCSIAGLPLSQTGQAPPTSSDATKQQATDKAILEPILPVSQQVDSKKMDFQVIVRRNIFQLIEEEEPIVSEEKDQVEKVVPEAVPTRLNLTLLGTILGDEQGSRAIIAEKNEQKLYRVGDAVQGAIVESIERGQVILDVFGNRETLTMKKREGGGPSLPFISRSPRITPPAPQVPQIEEEPENMDDLEELEEDDLVEEKRINTRRRPPAIRPHRRINFRRNPMRNSSTLDEEIPIDEPLDQLDEEVLPDLDSLPEDE